MIDLGDCHIKCIFLDSDDKCLSPIVIYKIMISESKFYFMDDEILNYFALELDIANQSNGFSSHVWMWELDYKESWALKNWCFWTVVLEKTLESPLDCKEIQPVHPKGNQSLIFIGRTDAEAETPILWTPDAKNWLTGKDPDAGKDWRWEEKEMTENEMVVGSRWRVCATPRACTNSMDKSLCKFWKLVMDRELGVLQSTE